MQWTKILTPLLAASVLAAFAPAVQAQHSADDTLLQMQQAFRKGERKRLSELLDEPQRRRIGLPVINKQHKTLTFHAWYPGCEMEEDAYGIPKPKNTELIVPTLLFVPCVGYGPGGYRLGYGGGFYDRTLASLQPRPATVGLGYTVGYVDDFEPEAHDQPLDAILNDHGVVWPV